MRAELLSPKDRAAAKTAADVEDLSKINVA
jgi:hypothetical protein